MAYLKTGNTVITKFVTFKKQSDATISVQTAIDGTEYLTRFGEPTVSYELELYVNDAGKELLERAADTLELLEVSVRIGTFTGRIKKLGSFSLEYYGWYKTTATLSAVNEVTGR